MIGEAPDDNGQHGQKQAHDEESGLAKGFGQNGELTDEQTERGQWMACGVGEFGPQGGAGNPSAKSDSGGTLASYLRRDGRKEMVAI